MPNTDVSEAYYAEDGQDAPPAAPENSAASQGQPPVTISISQSDAQRAVQLAQQGAYDELGRMFAGLIGGA